MLGFFLSIWTGVQGEPAGEGGGGASYSPTYHILGF